jgi:hypothetical protein
MEIQRKITNDQKVIIDDFLKNHKSDFELEYIVKSIYEDNDCFIREAILDNEDLMGWCLEYYGRRIVLEEFEDYELRRECNDRDIVTLPERSSVKDYIEEAVKLLTSRHITKEVIKQEINNYIDDNF